MENKVKEETISTAIQSYDVPHADTKKKNKKLRRYLQGQKCKDKGVKDEIYQDKLHTA
jgi:hypothetical protein